MNRNNTYSGLGPGELEFVARLTYEKKPIISVQEIDGFLPIGYKYRNQFLYNLKQKNILAPIKRGFYVFTPIEAVQSGIRVNELLIPPVFFPRKNYYVGYSSMFNYYGFTEQLFQTVYVLNTSLSQERLMFGVSYTFLKVSENRMYGIEKIKVQGCDVMVSSKERTLIDLMYFSKPVGGIVVASEIVSKVIAQKKCNVNVLIEFAACFPNITVRKRIGVICERIGVSMQGLRPLMKSIEKTAVSSLTGSRKGHLNKTWRVIVDDPQK